MKSYSNAAFCLPIPFRFKKFKCHDLDYEVTKR